MMEASRSVGVLPVAKSLCWGTHEEAARLGVEGQGTRKWAYRWIEEHVRHLGRVGVLADVGGGGVDSYLCNLLGPCADRVLVLDRIAHGREKNNIREVAVDLEDGLNGFADNSVDVFVSASSIEHLTAVGQSNVFAAIERVLKPGGVFCGTVSYITRLDPQVIQLINSDPVFEQTGSSIHVRFDANACLSSLKRLRPHYAPPAWSQFPMFDGFDESVLLGSDAFISDFIGSYGTVKVLPEIDALRLRWYEMGLFLHKDA
jgi:SAM-dependent methyltransferase